MPSNTFKHTPKTIGYIEICAEGGRALEALREYLDGYQGPNAVSLATVSLGENMPITALVQDDYETFTLYWCPAGWQR